ncbi:MAG: hypothetical protein FWH55_07905, partial [Oscillospiraceae bacterium]|nr:hypothetical protein [Oscillospiraceae bacterium]
TVVSGTGGGDYAAGASVAINADAPPSGKTFDKWTVTGGGGFADANSANTTFTMPASPATVTASYKDAPVSVDTIFNTKYKATLLNWILFFVCFGWIWMWF